MSEADSKSRVVAAEAQVKSLSDMVSAQAQEVSDYRRRMLLHVSSAHGGGEPLQSREQVREGLSQGARGS